MSVVECLLRFVVMLIMIMEGSSHKNTKICISHVRKSLPTTPMYILTPSYHTSCQYSRWSSSSFLELPCVKCLMTLSSPKVPLVSFKLLRTDVSFKSCYMLHKMEVSCRTLSNFYHCELILQVLLDFFHKFQVRMKRKQTWN